MAAPNQGASMDQFEAYFKRADLDQDGRISGAEAVSFFQGSGLPKQVLAQVCGWLILGVLLLWVCILHSVKRVYLFFGRPFAYRANWCYFKS